MIPESFIQELLNRVDIVEMINKVVPLKKTGKNYMACCPFSQGKDAVFFREIPRSSFLSVSAAAPQEAPSAL